MALLETQRLMKRFGGLFAISDVNLSIQEGKIWGLIGPNGAGKTTLFNLVSGFEKPTEGRVLFKGEDITGRKPNTIAGKGLVRTFQLSTLFSGLSVLDNVLMGYHLHRRKKANPEKEAARLLEFMGIAKLGDQLAKELPYGFQRIVGIAVALAAEPKLLMMDEPVTGMNAEERTNIAGLISRICHEWGITVLVVEHHMELVLNVCNIITVLNFGQKIAEGTPKEIQENSKVIEAYLGTEENVT